MTNKIDSNFWKNKKVFLTGHTGFKGAWLAFWLHQMGAKVKGYALAPATKPSLFECLGLNRRIESEFGDICDYEKLQNSMQQFQPDFVIHMAAQALVLPSYKNPVQTFAANIMGTTHVLEGAKNLSSVKCVLNITSDKCYENKEWNWAYRENEPLGGHDPYSASKAGAEIVAQSYRKSFYKELGKGLICVRAGNVIGGGDWAEFRIIPDYFRSVEAKKDIILRNPQSIRPWQHVLEPLKAYLLLLQFHQVQPNEASTAWNIGPDSNHERTVEDLIEKLQKYWNTGIQVQKSAVDPKALHEATYLKLDSSQLKAKLGWKPTLDFEQTMKMTAEWYQAFLQKKDMSQICENQIQTMMQ